ncbi:plastidic glucose transporter [Salix suchowensis]|nr:plastidic glucose transporter [Salix suchowensis]
MYRSFVTCDDPKGVVECGTIRKSKSGSHRMEHKIITQKAQKKNSKTDLAAVAENKELLSKGIVEEYCSPSSFQLLEVSRGAQKLNQTISSWSKGLSYDGQSKDIAKDLLKGALDMQDSLLVLGKLHEASHYMAQLKRQKEKLKRGKNNDVGAEMMSSHQFGDLHCQTGFQKPLLSAGGSSKDFIDELKKAVADSLGRQNLLPNRTTREKTFSDRRRRDSSSDVPSTSSSHSSVAHSSEEGKSPNLIAKLMGLKKCHQNHCKKIHINRWMLRLIQVGGGQGQSLILKCQGIKELKSWSHQSRETHTSRRSVDYISPIVLIKPGVPCFESKEVPAPMVWGMGALKAEMMPRKVKLKKGHEPDSRSVDTEIKTAVRKEVAARENKQKRIDTEGVKPKNISRSQEQAAKVISTKTRIEHGSMTAKTQITQQSSTNKKSILKRATKTTVHCPKDQKRKIVAEPTEEKPTNAGLGCKEDDKKSGYNCDFDPVSKVTSTKLAGQPSTGEAANVIKFHNEGRLLVGTGMGLGPPVASLYVTEVSPPFVRGTYGSFIQIATCLGLMGALLFGIPVREIAGWWRICFWVSTVPAGILALSMMFCAESPHWLYKLSGINAIFYFSSTVFKNAGVPSDLANAFVGIVNISGSVIAMVLMDKLGRKVLLLWSFFGMAVSMGLQVVAASSNMLGSGTLYLSVGGMLMFVFTFAIGAGPVPGLLLPEIFPSRIRAKAMAVCMSVHWVVNFFVGLLFLRLLEQLGPRILYTIFGTFCLMAVVFVKRNVTETKGKSLQEIEIALLPPE